MRTLSLVLAAATLFACNAGDAAENTGQSAGRATSEGAASSEAKAGGGGVSGGGSGGVADPTTIPSTGPVPDGCVRIEGGDIGEAGLVVSPGGQAVTFVGWTEKDGEGEYVGFQLSSGGAVAYAVKSGGGTAYGTGTSWVNPNGTSGPAASGISNITICPGPSPTDSESGGTPSGSDTCPGTEICPPDEPAPSGSESSGLR